MNNFWLDLDAKQTKFVKWCQERIDLKREHHVNWRYLLTRIDQLYGMGFGDELYQLFNSDFSDELYESFDSDSDCDCEAVPVSPWLLRKIVQLKGNNE